MAGTDSSRVLKSYHSKLRRLSEETQDRRRCRRGCAGDGGRQGAAPGSPQRSGGRRAP